MKSKGDIVGKREETDVSVSRASSWNGFTMPRGGKDRMVFMLKKTLFWVSKENWQEQEICAYRGIGERKVGITPVGDKV